MKQLKTLGLAATAAMALMAFVGAGSASGTKLYHKGASGETTYTGSIKASLESETSVKVTGTGAEEEDWLGTCSSSSIEGSITSHGGAGVTVSGPVSHLTFGGSGCSATVDQTKNGFLEIHNIAGTTHGTLTGAGSKVAVHSPFGECHYGLHANTDLGTLTGNTSGTATMHIDANVAEVEPRRLICPDTVKWITDYEVTIPDNLWVEAS